MLLPEPPKLSDYPVSSSPLLDWLRPRIDNNMLYGIASADYGYNEHKHYEALRQIRNTGVLSSPLDWHPREVLELVHWSDLDALPKMTPKQQERGNLVCAFCCAVLLEAAADPATYPFISSENDTIVQLIASVLPLGRIPAVAALSLLWRRILTLPDDNDERPFFALGILLLCASKLELVDDAQVRKTAEWVMQEEARGRQLNLHLFGEVNPAWLLGLNHFEAKDDAWRKLTREILLDAPRENEETASILHEIGRRIMSGSTAEASVE